MQIGLLLSLTPFTFFSPILGESTVAVSILSSPEHFHRSAFGKFRRAQADEVLREIPSPIAKGHKHQLGLCERAGPLL